MFVPKTLVAQGLAAATPPSCKPFTLHSNVCVADMIAIIACSIAGIGFFFWAIHAVRKMRQFPFNYKPEAKESNGESDRVDTYHIPSGFDDSPLVHRGVVQTPGPPERVRTRLAMSEPEEDYYRLSAPISTDAYYAQMSTTTPRTPPRAVGQFQRASSHRSSRHGSFAQGGPYSERYEYGMNDGYVGNLGPPRASGSPVRTSRGDYSRISSIEETPRRGVTHAY